MYLEAFRKGPKVKMVSVARNDPTILNAQRRPRPEYLATTECPAPAQAANFGLNTPSWDKIGNVLQRPIKDDVLANAQGSHWADNFGYGSAVAMSGDGKRVAVAYEGTAGFDKAFGAHIDIYEFENVVHHEFILQQTITDVTRFHGHEERKVSFESVAMSKDGKRVAFSDGHGIHVYEFDDHYHKRGSTDNRDGPWKKMEPEIDLKLRDSTESERKRNQAGIQIVMNCDGTVIAVSGKRQKEGGRDVSFAHVFHLEIRNDVHRVGYDWADLGEIDSVKYGGSIALDSSGRRLAVGSIAYDMWRGGVQVYDYDEASNEWHAVGQMILGEKELETWAGKVELNADGSILAVSTKNGNNGHVATYKLEKDDVTDDFLWRRLGQDLRGTGNKHEHFGADISISSDGDVLAIGAPGDRDLYDESLSVKVSEENKPYFQGRIYMYRLVAGQWVRVDGDDLRLGVDGDLLGKSIAVSSNGVWVIGGAPRTESKKSFMHLHGVAQVFRASL